MNKDNEFATNDIQEKQELQQMMKKLRDIVAEKRKKLIKENVLYKRGTFGKNNFSNYKRGMPQIKKSSEKSPVLIESFRPEFEILPGNYYQTIKRNIKREIDDAYFFRYLGDEKVDQINNALMKVEKIRDKDSDGESEGFSLSEVGTVFNQNNEVEVSNLAYHDNLQNNLLLITLIGLIPKTHTNKEMNKEQFILDQVLRKLRLLHEREIILLDLKLLFKILERHCTPKAEFYYLSCEQWEEKCFQSFLKPYKKHYCHICFIYDCALHEKGEFESLPFPDSNEMNSPPCGDSCYQNPINNENFKETNTELTYLEDDIVRIFLVWLVEQFGADSCLISQSLNFVFSQDLDSKFSCQTIHDYISAKEECKNILKDRNTKLNKMAIMRKNKKLKLSKTRLANIRKASKDNIIIEYEPCVHKLGEICDDNNCQCAKRGFCEKYCSCNVFKCKFLFPGCKCTTNCSLKTCPCFSNGRECDEELCGRCMHSESIDLSNFYSKENNCVNKTLRHRVYKQTAIAKSTIPNAGWGLFAKERINKNEMINEYVGEIVNNKEIAERGINNELEHTTYIFTLNEYYSVDSKYLGNKLRFANHSNENANAFPRIIFSEGKHKICLFASKTINQNEEILFDYNIQGSSRNKYPWLEQESKITKTSKKSGNKTAKLKTKNSLSNSAVVKKRSRVEIADLNNSFSDLFIPINKFDYSSNSNSNLSLSDNKKKNK